MKRIVITADDFGASVEVNEAVEQAHRSGVLKAASLMIGAPFAADAVARAKRLSSLRVGLHVTLTDGRPALPPEHVPALIDARGDFRRDLARFGTALFFASNSKAQMQAEMAAQFEAFRATGLALDHVNAHQHFHLHPSVGAALLALARKSGADAVRVPLEPPEVLARAEPGTKRASAWLTAPFARALQRRVRAAGMAAPDAVFGLAWSGAMTKDRLAGLIRHAPDGLSEIYLHPATGPYEGSAKGYRYAEELAALISPEVAAAVRDCGARLGGFADFR